MCPCGCTEHTPGQKTVCCCRAWESRLRILGAGEKNRQGCMYWSPAFCSEFVQLVNEGGDVPRAFRLELQLKRLFSVICYCCLKCYVSRSLRCMAFIFTIQLTKKFLQLFRVLQTLLIFYDSMNIQGSELPCQIVLHWNFFKCRQADHAQRYKKLVTLLSSRLEKGD